MKHNRLSWTQRWTGITKRSLEARIEDVEDTLRDFNVGTQHLRFKIVDVKPLGNTTYRIKVVASTSAVNKLISIWGEGSHYTLNGKRRMT